jgi:hypothetical protein
VYRTNGELLNRYDVGVNPGGVASSE